MLHYIPAFATRLSCAKGMSSRKSSITTFLLEIVSDSALGKSLLGVLIISLSSLYVITSFNTMRVISDQSFSLWSYFARLYVDLWGHVGVAPSLASFSPRRASSSPPEACERRPHPKPPFPGGGKRVQSRHPASIWSRSRPSSSEREFDKETPDNCWCQHIYCFQSVSGFIFVRVLVT